MSYREELATASARLARLDAVHAARVLEERRRSLEDDRAALTANRSGLEAVVFFAALAAAFVALRQILIYHREAAVGSWELLVVALGVAAIAGGWSFRKSHLRVTELTGIDAELLELVPEAHAAPATLAEAHERLRVREAEEEARARNV